MYFTVKNMYGILMHGILINICFFLNLNLQNQSKYFMDWLLSREKSTVICDFLLCFKFHILLSLNLISSVF